MVLMKVVVSTTVDDSEKDLHDVKVFLRLTSVVFFCRTVGTGWT